MQAFAAAVLALLLACGVASGTQTSCAAASALLESGCRQSQLDQLAPSGPQAACCQPFQDLLDGNCFCQPQTALTAHQALTGDAVLNLIQHCPAPPASVRCNPLQGSMAERTAERAEQAFLQAVAAETTGEEQPSGLKADDLALFPELQVFAKPTQAARAQSSQAVELIEDPYAGDYLKPRTGSLRTGPHGQRQEQSQQVASEQLQAASRSVEAVAQYLKALGQSTSEATAIDLDVGVSSQPGESDNVFRVQESADGTSFVLEFTLDADNTEAEQLVQAGYDILAGEVPRADSDFARRFQSRDMRLVAGALEELFATVARRGKALRAENPTSFQMELSVDVAAEGARRKAAKGAAKAAGTPPGDEPQLLTVQDLTVIPRTAAEQEFLCALENGSVGPCRPQHSGHSMHSGHCLAALGLLLRCTAVVIVLAALFGTLRTRRRQQQQSAIIAAEQAQQLEEPLLKPFAPESAFYILPEKGALHSPV